MTRVLILQHLHADGPAYLAHWLRARELPFDVFNTEAGQAFPGDLAGYGALAILGGEMSVNDELPALRQAEALFLQALARGVPTLGHCLGGQLMAHALGAAITRSPLPEVGWQPISAEPTAEAQAWLGTAPLPRVFQWHYEAFALPPRARRLAGSAACPHQAFAIGPHLAVQFHVEVDAEKLLRWSRADDPAYLEAQRASPGTVQAGAALVDPSALQAQQRLADRVYARWLGLASSRG